MPYTFTPSICQQCPFGLCFEDRRNNPIRGRKTQFRVRQQAALGCTFEEFVPDFDLELEHNLTFDEYILHFRNNILQAGKLLIGDEFKINGNALAKVEGDIYELLEATVLWNIAAAWNRYMDSGPLRQADREIIPLYNHIKLLQPESKHKIAIVKLPRRYDA